MGIRIHKMIGYGLNDVKTKKGELTDDRFHPEGVMSPDYEKRDQYTREGFIEWLASPDSLRLLNFGFHVTMDFEINVEKSILIDQKRADNFQYQFHFNAEFGLKKVLCITPLTQPEWHRYDNTLDYEEETMKRRKNGNACNYVKMSINGFYPYSSSFIDDRTGNRIASSEGLEFFRCMYWTNLFDGDEARERGLEYFSKRIGFTSVEEAKQHFAPAIPFSIIAQCIYGKLFKDPNTIWKLRPMMYVYWS